MRGIERVNLDTCATCGMWSATLVTKPASKRIVLPGTEDVRTCLDAGMHGTWDAIGHTQVGRLAHWALTTVIRNTAGTGAVAQSRRDAAHVSQDWIGCTNPERRTGAPSLVFDGYVLSGYGMTAARHMVAAYAKRLEPSEAYRWSAVASILRGPLARRG